MNTPKTKKEEKGRSTYLRKASEWLVEEIGSNPNKDLKREKRE